MKPKIRFNNNSWQKHKVGELCDLLTGYPFPGDKILNRGKNLLMRGINITEGRIRHSDEIDRYYNEDTIGLEKYRLQVGDLVIGMDGSKVGKNSALVTSKENYSLLVQRVARLRNEDKNLINLIQIAVGSDKFIKYVEEMKTSSAIPHISPADIRNFPLSLPEDSNERRLVASYFTSLESQISASTSRLASLKQMKAASLQAMFPQEGETVPKIRFKGFEGEWKKVKLSELYERSSIKNDLSFGTDKIISVANMYFIKNSRQVDDDYLRSYNIMRLGDIAFEGHKSKNFAHGRLVENTIGDGIVSHVFIVMKPISKNYDLNFWKYYINNENIMGNILVRSTKSSTMMTDLVVDDFLKESILVPSYEEQIEIGKILTSLDRQISLQSQRLEKLKQIKSACLDKMFV